jgi:release factor glutamine methyltransferase
MVKKYAKGTVLDMGTGSGHQALVAAQKKSVTSVLAVDINPKSVSTCKKINNPKITCKKSNLFSAVKEKFDTIIFNPPYLPQEGKERILALEGGKQGHEIIEQFLDEVHQYMNINGRILLVFSTHSKPDLIYQILDRNLLDYERVAAQKHFFEELFVYIITKRTVRKKLERKGVEQLTYLAQGKRGIVLTGVYAEKKVAVKSKRPSSKAEGKIAIESKFLKLLNKKGIGPRYVESTQDYLMYEFVPGILLGDWFAKASDREVERVLKKVLEQCRTMDELGITKEEMHHPLKHVIIRGSKVTMIDFERCHYTQDPKNVSQFCQYIMNRSDALHDKGIVVERKEWIRAARRYKKDKSAENFGAIVELLKKKRGA